MSSDTREYKKTLKNTIAFAGVQVLNVLISVIRGKFIAVFLGPAGVGINSIFTTAINLLSTATGFGLDLSTVREISHTTAGGDVAAGARIIGITQKLFFLSGVVGACLTLGLSPLLSKWSFGNYEYSWSFALIALVIFFSALSRGQSSILRGLRQVNAIIKMGLWTSVAVTIVSVPLYYFFGADGIVMALVAAAVVSLIISTVFLRRGLTVRENVSLKDALKDGNSMATLGIALVIATLIGTLTRFLINIFIEKRGDVDDVGYYAAAIAISTQYIGFILTSLSADYFPKLAAANSDRDKMNVVVNDQTEIVLILATPLLIIMLITAPLLIRLLLTKEFLIIIDFIRYIALGSFFQAAAYCMGYISFSKNDRKTYVLLEGVLGNILQLGLAMAGYEIYGINGLGIAFLACNVIYFVIIRMVTKYKYEYKPTRHLSLLFTNTLLLITACFLLYLFIQNIYIQYGISVGLLIISILLSYKELNKRFAVLQQIKLRLGLYSKER